MINAEQLDALEPQMRQAMLSLVSELQAQLQAKDELIARHDREAAFKQALANGTPWGPHARKFAIARDAYPGIAALLAAARG